MINKLASQTPPSGLPFQPPQKTIPRAKSKKKKAISDKQVPTVAAGQVSVQVPGEITSTSKSSEEQKHCFGISRLWFGFSRGNPAWEKQSRRCLQLHFFFLLFASIDRNSKAEAERAACTVLLLLLQTAWEETLTTRIKTFYVGMEGGLVSVECNSRSESRVPPFISYLLKAKSGVVIQAIFCETHT